MVIAAHHRMKTLAAWDEGDDDWPIRFIRN